MTEPMNGEAAGASGAGSAGAMLREARQARGMHIAALAAAIKVSQRKLEALEGDRYDELPDTTFTRALAQAVCRALKIDAEPVLAKLPDTPDQELQVGSGINAPLRQRTLRREGAERSTLGGPVVWISLALLVAAAAVYLLPPHLLGGRFAPAPDESASAPATPSVHVASAPAQSPAPSAPVAEARVASDVAPIQPAASLPALGVSAVPASAPASASASAPAAASGEKDVVVRATTAPSWVEVRDAHGQVMVARTLEPGESESLSGAMPMRVTIGNSGATQLSLRGQPVPLPAREGVTRLELK